MQTFSDKRIGPLTNTFYNFGPEKERMSEDQAWLEPGRPLRIRRSRSFAGYVPNDLLALRESGPPGGLRLRGCAKGAEGGAVWEAGDARSGRWCGAAKETSDAVTTESSEGHSAITQVVATNGLDEHNAAIGALTALSADGRRANAGTAEASKETTGTCADSDPKSVWDQELTALWPDTDSDHEDLVSNYAESRQHLAEKSPAASPLSDTTAGSSCAGSLNSFGFQTLGSLTSAWEDRAAASMSTQSFKFPGMCSLVGTPEGCGGAVLSRDCGVFFDAEEVSHDMGAFNIGCDGPGLQSSDTWPDMDSEPEDDNAGASSAGAFFFGIDGREPVGSPVCPCRNIAADTQPRALAAAPAGYREAPLDPAWHSPGRALRRAVRASVMDEQPARPAGITTVMIRNLPKHLTQRELLQELDNMGFRGLYDFCYMPHSFTSGENQGFAFANFTSAAAAGALIGSWHRQRWFGLRDDEPPLSIRPASVQGFAANVGKWDTARMRRIRNTDFLPFILRADSAGPCTAGPPPPTEPMDTAAVPQPGCHPGAAVSQRTHPAGMPRPPRRSRQLQ